MSKSKKDRLNFVDMPTYHGGNTALKSFLSKNLQYPMDAFENKIEGTVHVKYDIDYKGNVITTDIISGIGHGCDEEAQRIVKLLKFEVKRTRKLKVLFHKHIKIHFKMPKTQPVQVSYQYKAKGNKQVQKKKIGYNYSIQLK